MCDMHRSVPFVNKIRTEQNFRLQFLLHLLPQNHSKLNIYIYICNNINTAASFKSNIKKLL